MPTIKMKLEPGVPTTFSGEPESLNTEALIDTEGPSFVVADETHTNGEDRDAPSE